ncbi:hypothetical protein YTPLAS18_19640 [Nitrospira sp.]|nr:hypothetical protein YTPLAS18_19640 [Nitrospira sp.]
MVEAMRLASTPLMVAHTLRFDRALRGFRAYLPSVGALRSLAVTLTVPGRSRLPGNPGFLGRGPLLDLGVHVLDLVRWLTGAEVRQVLCRLDPADPSRMEETAEVELTLGTGCQCVLHVGWRGTERIGSATAEGDQGRATVDWRARTLAYTSLSGSIVQQSFDETATILETLEGFLTAVLKGTPMPVSALDALEAVRLVDACYESARRRRPLDV